MYNATVAAFHCLPGYKLRDGSASQILGCINGTMWNATRTNCEKVKATNRINDEHKNMSAGYILFGKINANTFCNVTWNFFKYI